MLVTHLCELCVSVVFTHEIDLLQGTSGEMPQYEKKQPSTIRCFDIWSSDFIQNYLKCLLAFNISQDSSQITLLFLTVASKHKSSLTKPRISHTALKYFKPLKSGRWITACIQEVFASIQVYLYSKKNIITFIPNLQIFQHYRNYAVDYMLVTGTGKWTATCNWALVKGIHQKMGDILVCTCPLNYLFFFLSLLLLLLRLLLSLCSTLPHLSPYLSVHFFFSLCTSVLGLLVSFFLCRSSPGLWLGLFRICLCLELLWLVQGLLLLPSSMLRLLPSLSFLSVSLLLLLWHLLLDLLSPSRELRWLFSADLSCFKSLYFSPSLSLLPWLLERFSETFSFLVFAFPSESLLLLLLLLASDILSFFLFLEYIFFCAALSLLSVSLSLLLPEVSLEDEEEDLVLCFLCLLLLFFFRCFFFFLSFFLFFFSRRSNFLLFSK